MENAIFDGIPITVTLLLSVGRYLQAARAGREETEGWPIACNAREQMLAVGRGDINGHRRALP